MEVTIQVPLVMMILEDQISLSQTALILKRLERILLKDGLDFHSLLILLFYSLYGFSLILALDLPLSILIKICSSIS
jgi:hypothetical protein